MRCKLIELSKVINSPASLLRLKSLKNTISITTDTSIMNGAIIPGKKIGLVSKIELSNDLKYLTGEVIMDLPEHQVMITEGVLSNILPLSFCAVGMYYNDGFNMRELKHFQLNPTLLCQ